MIDLVHSDVANRVQHELAESPLAEVRAVRVVHEGGMVFLQGRVRTFYAKQMAQETARRGAGELQIVNSVNVD